MELLYYSLAIYLSLTSPAYAASSKESKKEPDKPCTITSPTSGSFFDLNPLQILDPETSTAKHPRDYSYNATGWDMGYNFTMNICGPVVENVKDVVGVDHELWRNVSAYYKQGGKTYSLGMQNSQYVIRGRKLVLNYTDGSPCPSPKSTRAIGDLSTREIIDDDGDEKKKGDGKKKGGDKKKGDDDDDDDKPSTERRKTAIISMLCDRDPLAPTFALSFVASPDECSYFFEGRSNAACATANTGSGGDSLNPSGVFGVIALVAILVYVVGGCVYNRAVLQQRGWQQVPNYSLWASILGFFRDLFIIMTSSCAHLMPSRRGYSRVNGGIGGLGSRGRGRGDSDAENRLIDELNEEWED